MPDSKPFYQSKTFWVNVLMAAGAVSSGAFGVTPPASVALPIAAGVNIALRFLTSTPVTLTDERP